MKDVDLLIEIVTPLTLIDQVRIFSACGSAGSGEFFGPVAGETPTSDSGVWESPGQGGAGWGVVATDDRAGGQYSVIGCWRREHRDLQS